MHAGGQIIISTGTDTDSRECQCYCGACRLLEIRIVWTELVLEGLYKFPDFCFRHIQKFTDIVY